MSRRDGVKPRKHAQQDRSREKIEYILEAATQVFGALGYAATTTNKIADRAGVSIGTLYQYFPNKDAILLVLAEKHLRSAAAKVEAVARRLRGTRPNPAHLVECLVDAYVAAHDRASSLYRVLYREAPRTDELRAVFDRLYRRIAGEIVHHLHRLDTTGGDRELTAIVLVRALDALVRDVVLRPPPGRSIRTCVEEITRCCSGYLRYIEP